MRASKNVCHVSHQRLLSLLCDDRLREIAILRPKGYTIGVIAEKLTIAIRAVERMLQPIRSGFVTFLNHSE